METLANIQPPNSFPHGSTRNELPLTHRLKPKLPIMGRPRGERAGVGRSKYDWSGRVEVKARLKKPLEGVGKELNSIALQNLDHAPARRRVRSAFADFQQKLDHPLFKRAPAGIETEEWYETNSKGFEIFCKSWKPEPGIPIKGVVCFCHGYGDTCTFFFEGIAKQIAAAGYAIYALDHPGFGLSHGLHGYIQNFDELSKNAIEIYGKIKGRAELKGLPFFIFGQSMGGAVALKIHLKDPNSWDGIILVAPMCKIAENLVPPAPVAKALTRMAKIMPKAKLIQQEDIAELAFRDPKKREMVNPSSHTSVISTRIKKVVLNITTLSVFQAYYNVVCYNDRVRLKTAVELLNATKEIEAQVDKVSSPLLILHGAADKVTDPLISKYLYDNASSKDKTLKLYEEGYHSILEGEPDDRIFAIFNDIIAWLDSRCLTK